MPIIDLSRLLIVLLKLIVLIVLIGVTLSYALNLLQFIIYHINLSISLFISSFVHPDTLSIVQYSLLGIFLIGIIKALLPFFKS